MDTMQVSVLPIEASTEEVGEMVDLFKNAFGPDPLVEFTFHRPGVPQTTKEESVAKHLENLKDPKFAYRKAVDATDPSGPLLGAAVWFWVDDPQNSVQNIPWGDPPPGVHKECYEASFGALRRWRLHYFRDTNQAFLYMALLAVAPGARRRGIGRALLEEGLVMGDRRGVPAFVASSPDGLQLYKEFGWEEKVTVTVNLADYGGDDVDCPAAGLVRPAAAKTSSGD